MSALDELLSSWRANPDADATVALCSYLGVSAREDLIREVASSAETWHAEDPAVMLAVGRMYLDSGLLPESQAVLVAAGKLNARDPIPFRYLGEVLLRRGDAVRSEKLLARSIQLGMRDEETRLWHDRAAIFTALQQRIGVEAVAAEVARTMPKKTSIPAPTVQPLSSQEEPVTRPRNPSPVIRHSKIGESGLPRFSSDDAISINDGDVTRVSSQDAIRISDGSIESVGSEDPLRISDADLIEDSAPKHSPVIVTAGRKNGSNPNTPGPFANQYLNSAVRGTRSSYPPPAAAAALRVEDPYDDVTHIKEARIYEEPPTVVTPPPFQAQAAPAAARHVSPAKRTSPGLGAAWAEIARPTPPPMTPPPPTSSSVPTRKATTPPPLPAPTPPPGRAFTSTAVRNAIVSDMPAVPRMPMPSIRSESERPPGYERPAYSDQTKAFSDPQPRISELPNPGPGVVLQHLARVGVFEPRGGARPAWETPAKQKSRGVWPLLIAIVLLSGAGIGGWQYAKKVKAERAAHAANLNTEVARLLHTGSLADLRATDTKLSESFELDSLSQRAARLWLENRVLGLLLKADEAPGIDSAVHRGRTVGLNEKALAFGKVAGFLAEGDLAGGAAILPRSDASSGDDAMYQLVAGAVLERAGDVRAIERYQRAAQLDQRLVVADMLLVRMQLLEFGPAQSKPALDALRAKVGDQPMTRALAALAWSVDSERAETLPAEARLEPADDAALPAPLRAIPSMVEAVSAMRAGDVEKASRAIDAAIPLASSPGLAAELGFLALEAGNDQLARKAALRALQFAAVYPRARMLAARVALSGGRLDEAQKAIEELDPRSPDVAMVRAVVAYETLEPSDLQAALDALGESASTRHAYAGLLAAPGLISGASLPSVDRLQAMAEPAVPWGELVAIDAALSAGNLSLAEKLLAKHAPDTASSVFQLRWARLYRYQGKLEQAERASRAALDGTAATIPLLLERAYDLIQKEDLTAARDLAAKYPTLLGPMTAWLSALVDASGKQAAQAAARVAKLDVPPAETPFALRVLVGRALAASADKRAKPYVLVLAKQAPKHPDVLLAAQALK